MTEPTWALDATVSYLHASSSITGSATEGAWETNVIQTPRGIDATASAYQGPAFKQFQEMGTAKKWR